MEIHCWVRMRGCLCVPSSFPSSGKLCLVIYKSIWSIDPDLIVLWCIAVAKISFVHMHFNKLMSTFSTIFGQLRYKNLLLLTIYINDLKSKWHLQSDSDLGRWEKVEFVFGRITRKTYQQVRRHVFQLPTNRLCRKHSQPDLMQTYQLLCCGKKSALSRMECNIDTSFNSRWAWEFCSCKNRMVYSCLFSRRRWNLFVIFYPQLSGCMIYLWIVSNYSYADITCFLSNTLVSSLLGGRQMRWFMHEQGWSHRLLESIFLFLPSDKFYIHLR
jgi:hypothetical protein